MKKAKAPRVPVLESAFEVNLPKILRATKASSSPLVTLNDGDVRTVVAVTETRLAVHLGGRVWMADIVAVKCLNDRVRPLLKCPRAHEGNFQSLYWRGGELACRHCHALRYRSNLAPGEFERQRLQRDKALAALGGGLGDALPTRAPRAWRRRYLRLAEHLAAFAGIRQEFVLRWIDSRTTGRTPDCSA
jgi:hypothetical protein